MSNSLFRKSIFFSFLKYNYHSTGGLMKSFLFGMLTAITCKNNSNCVMIMYNEFKINKFKENRMVYYHLNNLTSEKFDNCHSTNITFYQELNIINEIDLST